jgi:hypothetical protein
VCWRIRTKKEMNYVLQGEDTVMFRKFSRVRCNCSVERTQKKIIKKNFSKSCNGSKKGERMVT